MIRPPSLRLQPIEDERRRERAGNERANPDGPRGQQAHLNEIARIGHDTEPGADLQISGRE